MMPWEQRGDLFLSPLMKTQKVSRLPIGTYIHLNPVRGGLIRIGQEPLQNYRWSSFPAYLVWKRPRPKWLRVYRVLAEHPCCLAGGSRINYERVLPQNIISKE